MLFFCFGIFSEFISFLFSIKFSGFSTFLIFLFFLSLISFFSITNFFLFSGRFFGFSTFFISLFYLDFILDHTADGICSVCVCICDQTMCNAVAIQGSTANKKREEQPQQKKCLDVQNKFLDVQQFFQKKCISQTKMDIQQLFLDIICFFWTSDFLKDIQTIFCWTSNLFLDIQRMLLLSRAAQVTRSVRNNLDRHAALNTIINRVSKCNVSRYQV